MCYSKLIHSFISILDIPVLYSPLFGRGSFQFTKVLSIKGILNRIVFFIDCNVETIHFMGNCFEFVEQVVFSSLLRLESLSFDSFSLCGNPDTVEENGIEFSSESIFLL